MKDGYTPTIGLEIHAELRTNSKMFCNSKNDTEEKRPNVNVCPVCLGYPGTLPTLNKQAIKLVLTLGTAVGGELADYTEFDRKNYFYPDIPKGYQISQYEHPLVKGGSLAGVELTRVHLEEDTAKSTHDAGDYSLVDFNRAGVPLMELVTEPVIHDAVTASRFARELQLLLVYLKASHANMEKGEMRVEANISVSKTDKLGTKVEVKNLNSFKAVEKAINFEIERHIELLEKGESVKQETRGWDENKEVTFSQRAKEDSHDYRYFPDPDLPKLFINEIPEFSKESILKDMPELPEAKRSRFKKDYALKDEDIEIFVRDEEWGSFFEEAVNGAGLETAKLASNYLLTDLASILKTSDKGISETMLTSGALRELMQMVEKGIVSSRGAKDTLKILSDKGGSAMKVAEENNLVQKSDIEEIKKVAQEIIDQNKKAEDEYKKGNLALLQFFVGQGMKAMKGAGNPTLLKSVFEDLLK